MIHVRFRPAPDVPMIAVDIDPAKHSIEAVLTRAMERVFPGPVDPKAEAESEARFKAVMAARNVRRETLKKR